MAGKTKIIIVNTIMQVLLMVRTLFLIPRGVCRYTPSCSAYAGEALTTLPLHRAVIAIVKRLLRCHPLSKGGYDPVYFTQKEK